MFWLVLVVFVLYKYGKWKKNEVCQWTVKVGPIPVALSWQHHEDAKTIVICERTIPQATVTMEMIMKTMKSNHRNRKIVENDKEWALKRSDLYYRWQSEWPMDQWQQDDGQGVSSRFIVVHRMNVAGVRVNGGWIILCSFRDQRTATLSSPFL